MSGSPLMGSGRRIPGAACPMAYKAAPVPAMGNTRQLDYIFGSYDLNITDGEAFNTLDLRSDHRTDIGEYYAESNIDVQIRNGSLF